MAVVNREHFKKRNILVALLAMADFITIFSSFVFAQWLRFSSGLFGRISSLRGQNVFFLLGISAGWLILFAIFGLYQKRNFFPILYQLFRLFKATVAGTILLLVLTFLLKADSHLQSRLFVGFSFLASLGFLFLWRGLLFSKLVCGLLGKKGVGRRALIVGAGKRGCHLARYITDCPSLGLDIVGFVDDKLALPGTKVGNLAVLGTTSDITEVVRKYDVGEIFLGIPSLSYAELLTLIDKCKVTQLPLTLTSELLDVVSHYSSLGKSNGIPAVSIQPNRFLQVGQVIKRIMDLILASLGLLMASPVLALSGALIKASSPGPVLFKQTRLGKNGHPFTIYKLRTMVSDQDDHIHRSYLKDFISNNQTAGENKRGEKSFKLVDDPRITRVGKFLRKLSLDELPQLINVIRGEMSLVGPRPPLPYEVKLYKDWHTKRLQVKPGITGLWQVSARSAVGFDDMVMLDLFYVEHWSLLFDLQLLLKTIPVALSGKGAL